MSARKTRYRHLSVFFFFFSFYFIFFLRVAYIASGAYARTSTFVSGGYINFRETQLFVSRTPSIFCQKNQPGINPQAIRIKLFSINRAVCLIGNRYIIFEMHFKCFIGRYKGSKCGWNNIMQIPP